MILLAIDPGPSESGWCIFDCVNSKILLSGIDGNYAVKEKICRTSLGSWSVEHLAIEAVSNFGMAAGMTLFDTCEWTGRFIECWGGPYTKIRRPDVLLHLIGQRTGKTRDVIYELTKRFGDKGTKKNPGPLFGVKDHVWSALAVAATWRDQFYAPQQAIQAGQEAVSAETSSA